MRSPLAILGLILISVFVAPTHIDALQEGCDADCVSILSAGIDWLLEEHAGMPPADIVIDTVMSGVVFFGESGGVREVDRGTLNRLATSTGMDRGSQELVECDESLPHGLNCRLRRGKMLVTIPPPLRDSEKPGSAFLEIRYHVAIDGWWIFQKYRLTLERDAARGWEITEARLVGQS